MKTKQEEKTNRSAGKVVKLLPEERDQQDYRPVLVSRVSLLWQNDSAEIRMNISEMEKRLISIQELALYLSLSPQTIRNRLSAGTFEIPPIKIGGKLLWDKRKVDEYISRSGPGN